MQPTTHKEHWDRVFNSRRTDEVSWYQPVPLTSLRMIQDLGLARDACVIDIGGGDSLLADHLLREGFTDVTVLDISAAALDKAKTRLGDKAQRVRWIVADVLDFEPQRRYDLWHDRAAFHFLIDEGQIDRYIGIATEAIMPGGSLILGTFSTHGPEECSGLPVHRYSEEAMMRRLKAHFQKVKCITVDHTTPSDKTQNFIFCGFKKQQ